MSDEYLPPGMCDPDDLALDMDAHGVVARRDAVWRREVATLDDQVSAWTRQAHGQQRARTAAEARIATLEADLARVTGELRDVSVLYREQHSELTRAMADLAAARRDLEEARRAAGDYQVQLTAMSYDLTHALGDLEEARRLLAGLRDWFDPCLACDDDIEGAECTCGEPDPKLLNDARALLSRLKSTPG